MLTKSEFQVRMISAQIQRAASRGVARQIRNPYSPEAYARAVKVFHALIAPSYKPLSEPALRVSVEAVTRNEARTKLEAIYGVGMVLSSWIDREWSVFRPFEILHSHDGNYEKAVAIARERLAWDW